MLAGFSLGIDNSDICFVTQHFLLLYKLTDSIVEKEFGQLSQTIRFQAVINVLSIIFFIFLICNFENHDFLLWTEHNPNPAHYQWDLILKHHEFSFILKNGVEFKVGLDRCVPRWVTWTVQTDVMKLHKAITATELSELGPKLYTLHTSHAFSGF